MPRVIWSGALARWFDGRTECAADGATVAEVLRDLDRRVPGLRAYVVDDRGRLRRHVNVFVDGDAVGDRAALGDPVPEGATVHVLQAVSGG